MKKAVIFSEDDYKTLVTLIHDCIIDAEKVEDGYFKSEVINRLNKAYDILQEEQR